MQPLPNAFYQNFLTKMASSTIEGAFQKFIAKEIVITLGHRQEASDSHNALRDFLRKEHQADSSFPVLLQNKDADFIGGSFGRGTKIWPLDDIDMYFPMDGYNLSYTESGGRLPYKVISDDGLASNPLSLHRWLDGQNISSKKLVSEFANVLRRKYPRTKIKPNGESVSLYTTVAATTESEGLCYDVVPCFLLKHDYGTEPEFYLMPDGNDGWMRTNPRLDDEIASKLNNANNETYKKVVRLLKYWNKDKFTSALSSYYIELSVAKQYNVKNNAGISINKISEGLMNAFSNLNEVVKQGDQKPFLGKAPDVKRGAGVGPQHLSYLEVIKTISNQAIAYESYGNHQKALESWRHVFGEKLEG